MTRQRLKSVLQEHSNAEGICPGDESFLALEEDQASAFNIMKTS